MESRASMKSITKSCFYLILFLLSPLVVAGQNDYDGKWNVDFTCSINSKNQRPGFSYSEVWDIKGNSIRHIFKTTTKYGAEQTIWDGQITNKNISLKADASRDNGDSWSWIGQGSILSPEAFQINAIMNDKFGTRIRDCVIKFASINPAVGSLAYIQSHPQKPAQKVEALKIAPPAVKPAQTPSISPTAEIKKPVEVKEEPIKEPAQRVDKEPPAAVQTQQPNVQPKPTSTITSETDYWMYLIALALLLLIAVFGFVLIRRKGDLGSDHSRKLEEELRKKAEANELIARELERDKEQLKKFEQELKEKEISLVQKSEQISAPTQPAQTSISASKFCVSCGQNIKFDIKFCPACGAENKISRKPIDVGEQKANKYILKVVAFIFFAAVIAILVFVSTKTNTTTNKNSANPPPPAQSTSDSIKSRLQQGVEYTWYNDSSCKPSNSTVCLSFEDYQSLCTSNEGLTKNATDILGIFVKGYSQLLKGGVIEDMRAYWSPSHTYKCRATVTVSGIYQGNSARVTADGGVSTFILNSDNKLLVHSATTMSY